MKPVTAPAVRDIVLLGGGHANVQVLKRFGMRPEPGLRLTMVAREPHTPYSGMLPGLIAGVYDFDDVHIDLARLCTFAQARFIAAEATGLDLDAGRLAFADRPALRYDVLAINTGGVPGAAHASDFVTPVKPIGRFLPAWRKLLNDGTPPARLAIVGAGAGGVELALAIRHLSATDGGEDIHCAVVDAAPTPLAGFSSAARRRLVRAMTERGVELLTGFQVMTAREGRVEATDGRGIDVDHVLWVSGVEAPRWARESGLATDDRGFIAVNCHLQSTSDANVFAAGDVAALSGQPRPKSGVYSVRQGPALAANVRRSAIGKPLSAYRAQRHALAIVGLGAGKAVASRGPLAVSGRWVWSVKQWIDRRFMRKFNVLPQQAAEDANVAAALKPETPSAMRCGGCGAKVGADILRRVLARLDVHGSGAVLHGIGDDAAVVRVSAGNLAMTCDGFRAMVDDPYRLGRIGAHHALNDLFAMGAVPAFALALATVPAMAEALVEEDLFQLMSGATAVFRAHDVALVGGHSGEGAELGIAFSVTGTVRGEPLEKGGLVPGQKLVLTKPLGTGVLLAGAMQGETRAEHLVQAINVMDTSNAAAVKVLSGCGATACTDVTGFGLAGHASEMVRTSQRGLADDRGHVGVRLFVDQHPALPGAHALLANDIESSLQRNNERALEDFTLVGVAPNAPEAKLVADPQTAGGLLASVPASVADDCVASLQNAGYAQAAVIGEVTDGDMEIRRSSQ